MATLTNKQPTLGVIVGNRGFFPKHLCVEGRKAVLNVMNELGIQAVIAPEDATAYGSVESMNEARLYADLFRQHRDDIDGILVTLPNFGDERAVANTIRWADLGVPVLVHAFNDDAAKMTIADRRDSFCGKMSVCNNLAQYGIKFSLTTLHTCDPTGEVFKHDLRNFVATCRVVRGLKHARVGALGARPQAFNTVRYSEKLLELSGISVETLDLSEAFGRIGKLSDGDPAVKEYLDRIRRYASVGSSVPQEALIKMAKLGVVIERWMDDTQLDMTAIQCWTSMEEYFGVVPCTIMSMMSDRLQSSACETDVAGAVGMYAMALASGKPSALVDWNNNYGEDPDKAVIFHCSNLPAQVFTDIPVMEYQEIIAGTVGAANTYGTMYGRVKAEPFTFCRVSTNDARGRIEAYVGEGETTDDPLSTFGGYGVVRVNNMQALLRYICENGFEHHVAMNLSRCADAVAEALGKYLGWSVYRHR
ncbi:MAG: L-fucose/L-arabinose isomerase family protein [Anaerolineae bacterium]|nr:L-fucose/L-arabinose isomerase family protein [Anaerolineae bacterium]